MKLVDIAVFNFLSEASILGSLLSAENIQCFLNNQQVSIIIPGSGVTLSVEASDKERAIQIIKEAGFEKYLTED